MLTFAVLSALVTFAAATANNITLETRSPHTVDVLDERGWQDVSFGLMLERRDADSPALSHLFRRAHPETRDVGTEEVEVKSNKRGEMMLPAGIAQQAGLLVRRDGHQAHKQRRASSSSSSRKRVVKKQRKSKKKSKSKDVSSLVSSAVKAAGKTFAAKITWCKLSPPVFAGFSLKLTLVQIPDATCSDVRRSCTACRRT